MSLTVKTDDVTNGRRDVDRHGRFRGEWPLLNDVEIPETKRFISKGFELGTTLSQPNRSKFDYNSYLPADVQNRKKSITSVGKICGIHNLFVSILSVGV